MHTNIYMTKAMKELWASLRGKFNLSGFVAWVLQGIDSLLESDEKTFEFPFMVGNSVFRAKIIKDTNLEDDDE